MTVQELITKLRGNEFPNDKVSVLVDGGKREIRNVHVQNDPCTTLKDVCVPPPWVFIETEDSE